MILDDIVNKKLKRLGESRERNLNDLDNLFRKELISDKFSIIGEFKKASPSKGIIVEDFSIDEILKKYEESPINCYSVLTEEDYFLGNKEYLKYISNNTNKPILRKDFIVNPIQVIKTKEIGASGILLIASILGERLGEFYELARYIGLTPLVEVHNREELDLALKCDVEIIGINNRDLKTFNTNLKTTEDLLKFIPKDKVVISESGVKTLDDFKYVKSLGVKGVLVGEALMRNIDNLKEIISYE